MFARRAAWAELGLLASVYVLYSVARSVTAGGSARAVANARGLLDAERAAHLSPERWLNHVVSSRPWLAVAADYDYATLHYLVTPAVLVWLWRRHRDAYAPSRRALVAATLLGLLGFVTMPLAPARMMPGFVDTMARYGHDGWWGSAASAPKGMGSLTNQFAAMPSLHVGWALWCGWMIVANARRNRVRVLGALYPLSTSLVVLSTANHYLADVAGGVAVLVCGAVIARIRVVRRGRPVRRVLAHPDGAGWPVGRVRLARPCSCHAPSARRPQCRVGHLCGRRPVTGHAARAVFVVPSHGLPGRHVPAADAGRLWIRPRAGKPRESERSHDLRRGSDHAHRLDASAT
jgi:hypothetical protein